jgi:homoserine acetyltransferase
MKMVEMTVVMGNSFGGFSCFEWSFLEFFVQFFVQAAHAIVALGVCQ